MGTRKPRRFTTCYIQIDIEPTSAHPRLSQTQMNYKRKRISLIYCSEIRSFLLSAQYTYTSTHGRIHLKFKNRTYIIFILFLLLLLYLTTNFHYVECKKFLYSQKTTTIVFIRRIFVFYFNYIFSTSSFLNKKTFKTMTILT